MQCVGSHCPRMRVRWRAQPQAMLIPHSSPSRASSLYAARTGGCSWVRMCFGLRGVCGSVSRSSSQSCQIATWSQLTAEATTLSLSMQMASSGPLGAASTASSLARRGDPSQHRPPSQHRSPTAAECLQAVIARARSTRTANCCGVSGVALRCSSKRLPVEMEMCRQRKATGQLPPSPEPRRISEFIETNPNSKFQTYGIPFVRDG